jgi:hypothetical protein
MPAGPEAIMRATDDAVTRLLQSGRAGMLREIVDLYLHSCLPAVI